MTQMTMEMKSKFELRVEQISERVYITSVFINGTKIGRVLEFELKVNKDELSPKSVMKVYLKDKKHEKLIRSIPWIEVVEFDPYEKPKSLNFF